MRALLDTHTLLWYALGDPRLSDTAREFVLDMDNSVLISPATYWEIAIKVSIGKLVLHSTYEDFIRTCFGQYGFKVLPIEPSHTARLVGMPFPPNHRDPFDRLLVTQALSEDL